MSQSPIIPWQTRSDLKVVNLGGQLEQIYAVKDVVGNEFFRFGEIEFYILEALKKTITLDGLKRLIEDRFGFSLGTREVMAYLNHLASDNLLVAKGLGDGVRLFRQHERIHSTGYLQKVMGLMSIKLPGFYPGPMLSVLRPVGMLLFNPAAVAAATIAFLATAVFAILSWQSLATRVPSVAELLSVEHLFLMAIGFAIAKVFHEIGHGLACRQTGHECSEMGVLLLVMIPCLYCDVSDMWTAKSRYKRLLVSLAGVFVELSLATLCFWGWYFSIDGTFNRFLFGMMLVTSVNTLFVNGNPLMKYDGYYALSDFLKIHNLSTIAQKCLNRTIDGFFFGMEPSLTLHQKSHWLKAYAVGSVIYRWIILSAIGWMAWTFFENQQLLMFGRIVIVVLLIIAILPMLLNLQRFWRNGWRFGIRWVNTLFFLAAVGAIVWLASQFEFEHRVSGQAIVKLADAKQVFAPDAGVIVASISDGDEVEAGDPIAKVINDELLLEKLIANEQVKDVSARLAALQHNNEKTAAAEIEFWKKRKDSWSRKLDDINRQISKLSVVSPSKGKFVAQLLPRVSLAEAEEVLVAQNGSWAHDEYAGGSVERGENLGYVADPATFEGTVQIAEKDIELVEKNQEVRIFLPFKKQFFVGNVTKISAESEPVAGAELANSGAEAEDEIRFYRVEFQFPFDERVRIGSSRKAVILCRKTNVFQWTARWIHGTFWL
jgi:putative peptide zinc metalloprotease protein